MSIANQSPGISTFDLTAITVPIGPYRPGAGEFNGNAKVDESAPEDAPDPQTMPNAPEANTAGGLLIAYGKVIPQVTVSVKQAAGVYSVDLLAAASNNILAANVQIDKNGVGDVSVHVLVSKLANGPGGQAFRPKVSVNEDATLIARAVEFAGTIGGQPSRGARVKLFTTVPAAAEGAFTVDIG